METVLISLRFQLSSDSEHFRGDPDLQLGLQQGPEPRLAGLDLEGDQHQVLGQHFSFSATSPIRHFHFHVFTDG